MLFRSRFCARAFSSCGERGPLFIAVHGPLTVAASPIAEHRLQTHSLSGCGSQAQLHRLSGCGSWAQLLRGVWDLPGPGLKPVSPALAGRFSTTAPPGKPRPSFLMQELDFKFSSRHCFICISHILIFLFYSHLFLSVSL